MKINSTVRYKKTGRSGKVLSIKNNKALVKWEYTQSGIPIEIDFKSRVNTANLEVLDSRFWN